jgi:hypothetical protein
MVHDDHGIKSVTSTCFYKGVIARGASLELKGGFWRGRTCYVVGARREYISARLRDCDGALEAWYDLTTKHASKAAIRQAISELKDICACITYYEIGD